MMHDSGKSDRPVVPAKPSNNAEPSAAERVEERGLAKGNTDEQNAPRTQRRAVGAPSALDRVRQRASKDRKVKFTTLMHHVTVDRLRYAFLQLQRKAAPGVDGVTWKRYAADLEDNLAGLYARLHHGAYRAKPSRKNVHPQGRRAATAARHRLAGRQACPTSRGRRHERHLRRRLPRLLLRIPARTQPASSAGRARGRNEAEEGELGARRRHPWFLRCHRPRMADEVSRAPNRGQAGAASHPEVAERRGNGEGSMVGQ